ncbi:MAG: ATPase [marine bacterium B5-7]|nr:MAG: ATPase [marine bacterium B5-7]
MYQQRTLEAILQSQLKHFCAVGVTGPRQSGKSTLLRHMLPDYRYVTFDKQANVNFFQDDPDTFMREYADRVIFDEAQKQPLIFEYLKVAIDNDRDNYGKFVVSGSNQFNLQANISESLAGRIGLLTLLPLQFSEIPETLHQASVYKGGFPELIKQAYVQDRAWFEAYVDTYVNKDVRQVENIGNLRDFRRLLYLLAAHTGQTLNMSSYAKALGVSVPTIKRWISVLEASYIIYLLPPYFKNLGKRLVKSPKIYFYDTGLVSFLTGIETKAHFEQGLLAGPLFENYVISEVLKLKHHHQTFEELYYLRTANGEEIDLIIDNKREQIYVEIKKSGTFSVKMASTLKKYVEKPNRGVVVYRGDSQRYTEDIQFMHYDDFFDALSSRQ